MKFPKLVFLFCFISASVTSFAQGFISGKIVDADTKEPLVGASVFAQNTTKGTATDKEGKYSFYLPKGGYEIVVSFTGYASRSINVDVTTNREFNLELQKADNTMSEVIIKSSNEVEDGWQKYGQFFITHFIGATPFAANCKLLNPEVLKFLFFKKSNRLKVLATAPLQIENKSLGYNLRYELDSFVNYYNTDINSYRGHCLYTEMDGDSLQKQVWKTNRKKAYYGSRLQFLRSYYDSTLEKDGFIVDILSSTQSNKFDKITNPYDTAYYFFNDSTGNAELFYPAKVSVTYNKKKPEREYLQQYHLPLNVPIQISYVDLSEGIAINPNGYFTDQNSWINEGYWSWKNLADQLPYDYDPDQSP